jgi:hypothetical protein
MVFGNASVTEFKFDRNAGALLLAPQTTISSSTFPPLSVERTTTSTDGYIGSYRIIATSSGDMTDGFGVNQTYWIKDTAGVNNEIAKIGARRSGADNSGRLVFSTFTTGTETEKMTILPNGNVGIGTASPVRALSITTTSNDDGIQIRRNSSLDNVFSSIGFNFLTTDNVLNFAEVRATRTNRLATQETDLSFFTRSNNVSAERLRIRDDGNVGIGTSSPATKLHISGSVAQELRLENTNTAIGLNDLIGSLSFRSNDASTGGTGIAGSISSISEAVSGVTYGLAFNTKNFASETEKMRITAEGRVGIGTSAPASQLHTLSNGTTINTIETTTTGGTGFALIAFKSTAKQFDVGLGGTGAGNNLANKFYIWDSTLSTARLVVDTNGLVGINETSPTAQLQVKSGAVDRPTLILNTLASHTASVQNWQINGSNIAYMANNGALFLSTGLANLSSSSNSFIATATTGTTISRNVADTNPALIVNLANASATGNIQVWQKAGSALSQISNAGIFVGQSRPTRTDITANATLALADEGKVLRVNSSSNLTITIPKNSAVAFPIDTEIAILRYGTGTVSIAPVDGDVTLQSKNAERKISDRYGSVALKKIGENEWVLVGSLEA